MEDNKTNLEQKSNAWGISSLVTGIVSILIILAPYFGLPLAIFSIVANYKQKKIQPNGYGTAGLVLGIIGVVLNSIMLLFVLIALLFVGASM